MEFAGALYYVTARGNARAAIYLTDEDRIEFLTLLADTVARHDWYCHAYCLMDNHYHLLIETTRPTLSKGMKFLNGTYTQSFNRTHTRVGHLFQGRYKAILVQKDTYLLELARYIVLNPVRARMVHEPEQWPWSSYRAMVSAALAPECLGTDWVSIKPLQWFEEHYPSRAEPSRAESMAAAYLSGHYTLTQVGAHFGVSYATVSRAAKSKVNVKCKTSYLDQDASVSCTHHTEQSGQDDAVKTLG